MSRIKESKENLQNREKEEEEKMENGIISLIGFQTKEDVGAENAIKKVQNELGQLLEKEET